jgi:hypothetical protein
MACIRTGHRQQEAFPQGGFRNSCIWGNRLHTGRLSRFGNDSWEDLKITAKDAKGAKQNMKTSGCWFYNILNNII